MSMRCIFFTSRYWTLKFLFHLFSPIL